jgi:hypothetical protein
MAAPIQGPNGAETENSLKACTGDVRIFGILKIMTKCLNINEKTVQAVSAPSNVGASFHKFQKSRRCPICSYVLAFASHEPCMVAVMYQEFAKATKI